ncbi:hypothetical protein [Acanthopleuribacter pedis]|uniref:Uncharacterized protein n=1 Tax=Acanthopleuribacter pedis TaxID=442870 RepID=A0A8J7PYV3_9BACT|nr:hypothetical protein [Acanthopleuribacter pedis]MBO1317182.1 hypothetical protein [Acanthopleuribacter pedis]
MTMTMVFLLSLPLAFQEAEEEKDDTRFLPVTEGNVIEVGPFLLTVPTGILMAYSENAQYMYRLLHVENIPNCEAVMFSMSGTWTYGISVQWFPSNNVLLEPIVDAPTFERLWNQRDVVSGKSDGVPRTVIYPFTVNLEEHSAFFGYKAEPKDEHSDIVARKVYVSDQGALIMTLRSNVLEHDAFEEEILRVFHEAVSPPGLPEQEVTLDSRSYLTLFGVPLKQSTDQSAAEENAETAAEEGPNLMMSGVVIVLALGVLGFAVFLSRKS